MQDFRKYTGIADIPEIPLVKQIEHLQAEARRREAALKNRDVSNNQRKGHNGNRRTQENSNASGIERSGECKSQNSIFCSVAIQKQYPERETTRDGQECETRGARL